MYNIKVVILKQLKIKYIHIHIKPRQIDELWYSIQPYQYEQVKADVCIFLGL